MKNEVLSLVAYLSILINGCAHAMGKAPDCQAPELPARPQYEICISNGSGGGGCYDPRRVPSEYNRPSLNNYVCYNAISNQMNEEWIKFIIDSCKRD